MPRYYFHLLNHDDVLLDDDSEDLPDLDAVREKAIREARGIIAADALEGVIDLGLGIEVRDASGSVVMRLSFDQAVAIERK